MRFVIFGASGDLTSRFLVPALAQLHEHGHLPGDFEILGTARDEWDDAAFRRHVAARIEEISPNGVSAESLNAVITALRYRQGDVTRREDVRAAAEGAGTIIAYLALPPFLFEPVIESLANPPLPDGSRIVVEKPFGEDLASARRLNKVLHEAFPEGATFRMDHFLGEQAVRALLGLRFANRVFAPLWNRDHIEAVNIVWDETVALEGRAGYYDKAGALLDMVQNHLLQVLSLVALEPPAGVDERSLRDRKVEALRSVRRLSPEEVAQHTVRARYGAGSVGGKELPAYVDEEGVDPGRETETFAQITFWIDNDCWKSVPFTLRTGKALDRDLWEVAIRFRPAESGSFAETNAPNGNVLRLDMSPDVVSVRIWVSGSQEPSRPIPLDLTADLPPDPLSPYARILLEVLRGDPTWSIRDDEAEECWRIVEPVVAEWKKGKVPLSEYPAGSDGPL